MNRRLAFSDNLIPTQVNAMAYDIPAFQHIPGPNSRVGYADDPYLSPNAIQQAFNTKAQSSVKLTRPATTTAMYDPFLIEPTRKPVVDLRGHSVEELARAANVSVDTIKMAIKRREQFLLEQKLKDQQVKFLEQYNFDVNGLDVQPTAATPKQPIRRPTTARTTATTSLATSTTTSPPRPTPNVHGNHKVGGGLANRLFSEQYNSI